VQISTYSDLAGGTQAVLTGRSSVFMEPDSFAYQAAAQYKGKLGTTGRIPQGDTYIGFAITKSEATLGDALLAASKALQADGTEAKLFAKWKQSTAYVAAPEFLK
jgi:ABC-type amino acid transport substrate-binding protein